MELPVIHVHLNTMKTWELFVNGEKVRYNWYPSKRALTRYLKNTYGIDLRTDKRITRNYIEYEQRKVFEKNGVQTITKRPLTYK